MGQPNSRLKIEHLSDISENTLHFFIILIILQLKTSSYDILFAHFYIVVIAKYYNFWELVMTNYVFHYSPWDWGNVGIKSGTKHVINLKLADFIQENDIYANRFEHLLWHENVCFMDQNIVHKGEPHKTKFGRFWNAKMKYTNEKSSKSRWEKWDRLLSGFFPRVLVIKGSLIYNT